MTTSEALPVISEALEFLLLRRACAAGTPEQDMIADLPVAGPALAALCAAGRLTSVNGHYTLTYSGEDRLDALFERAQNTNAPVTGEDLRANVLRLLATFSDLNVQQVALVLGATPGSAARSLMDLIRDGMITRRPRQSPSTRGRRAFVYARAS